MTHIYRQQNYQMSSQNQDQAAAVVDDRIFFNVLEKAGTIGRYQNMTLVLWSLVSFLCGGLMLIVPYLLYQDPYQCPGLSNDDECRKIVCSLPPDDRVDFIPQRSILTLGNQFGDFRCDIEKIQIDSVASLMYLGGTLGFISLTLIGGIVGRKMLMLISTGVAVLGLIITVSSVNLIMAGAGLLIASFGVQKGFNVCLYFISQTIAESHREKYSILVQLFFGMGVILNVLFFYTIGNWRIILIIFYLIPTFITFLGVWFLVYDTPQFLITKYEPQKSLEIFEKIAKMNKKYQFDLTVQELSKMRSDYQQMSRKQNKSNFTVLDLFKYKSLRLNTVLLVLIQIIVAFLFYAPALMIDQFKMDIYVGGIVVGASEVIAYPIIYFTVQKSPRKKVALVFFSICAACSVGLLFVWDAVDPTAFQNVMKLILIFIFRFAITYEYAVFIVYFNELFPTQIRVIGTGFVSLFGCISTTMAPILIQGCQNSGFPVMIIFIVTALISIAVSIKLPQTFNRPPADVIDEFKVKDIEKESLMNPQDSIIETIDDKFNHGLSKALLTHEEVDPA